MGLIEQLRWWAAECDRTNFGCQAKELLLKAADVLEKAEPVKQGRWIEQEDFNSDVYYDCSVCGDSFCFIEGTPADNLYCYCPNCGSKMDLEG